MSAKQQADVDLLTWADPFYPDGRLPASVLEALRSERVAACGAHYGDVAGLPSLRQAVAGRLAAVFGYPIVWESQVLITPGSASALYLAVSLLASPDSEVQGDDSGNGDVRGGEHGSDMCDGKQSVAASDTGLRREVIVPDPGFPNNAHDCAAHGLTAIPLTLDAENGYQITVEQLERVVSERTCAIMVTNPANPTTTVLTRESCEAIAQVAERHNLTVINDEAFADHMLDGREFLSVAALPSLRDRCITIRSFSKGYGLSGLRVGCMVAPASVFDAAVELADDLYGAAGTIDQIAAEAALRDSQLLDEIGKEFQARAQLVRDIVGEVDCVRVEPIESGFLSWIDVSRLGGGDVVAAALRDAGIAVQPGSHYGPVGASHIRISQGAYRDRHRVEGVLRRLAEVLRSLPVLPVLPVQ
ncbi:pyridoxal phosphate-dependent aminotransferase [Bifidobacterium tibiigranuli]|jgi:aspartate/methionine/tyrosine aminotransferase|uniref:pyridoxal phosphate-dependent aminotransferase n=1 Tax=Bifidobacterium tibiigranuli TaxID=2172043 RepID=UPI00235621C9|nr:pyridoxal phosphate-dependent aminotransferase [Bifidobacterium tibiigranuli]MCI1211362.1 pyridoxal phosphate-dependent aminotransferase [Bifidobacterium tibiigranuli]MCI1222214.1 pyridoxal phosphate-dependent aminotransferase [Bifidobacterium tibiigranuli]MCI1233107.1 pyridoxal phosphate-dependent aminotransferase [Bifidobacterium tibiigranuli]MCI1254830.1 pyridoxal phosphate-dependent aminotransferase [Bifidobacterium tibiigranuli]